MKLIIGLGNVGSRYARTRHNIGFTVVDAIASMYTATWKVDSKLKAEIATFTLDGEKVVLAKPHTMMNLSGEAAQRIVQFYKLTPNDVWAIYDDIDTNFGRMRVRHGGSAGGHQGVRSLVQHIGEEFLRIRIGISLNDRATEPSEVYVLKPFNDAEQNDLPYILESAVFATSNWIGNDADKPTDETVDLNF